MNQANVQALLNAKLLEMKTKNPSFSMRAFARKIEMNPAAVSGILRGTRRISKNLAIKISNSLLFDPTERQMLLKDFPEKLKRSSSLKVNTLPDFPSFKLTSAQFDYLSNWENFAFLSLMETSNFFSDVGWIAQRLKISESRVLDIIDRLSTLGLITQNQHAEFKRTSQRTNTPDDIANISIKRAHLADLETAKEKLLNTDVKNRDFTSYTLAFDPDLMPVVKEMIRKMQNELSILMKDRNRTEVYKINTYLYPLTDMENK